ncbi:MAG TPA: hypothetical protein PK357_02790 [Candidatus Pacearchaeota archaeon]|nr:hypothetical protein [Candidatus Pacearchaeota archaeon]
MANNDYPVESSELVRKIRKLDFVKEAHTEVMNGICLRNFNNTLFYKKETGEYIAKVNLKGHSYKIIISINGNRPNPKYEKMIKKCF